MTRESPNHSKPCALTDGARARRHASSDAVRIAAIASYELLVVQTKMMVGGQRRWTASGLMFSAARVRGTAVSHAISRTCLTARADEIARLNSRL